MIRLYYYIHFVNTRSYPYGNRGIDQIGCAPSHPLSVASLVHEEVQSIVIHRGRNTQLA